MQGMTPFEKDMFLLGVISSSVNYSEEYNEE
jgi:hypothetical protein